MSDAFDVEAEGDSFCDAETGERGRLRDAFRRAIAHGKRLGAEEMRERAAAWVACMPGEGEFGDDFGPIGRGAASVVCDAAAETIRALLIEAHRALPIEPQEGGDG